MRAPIPALVALLGLAAAPAFAATITVNLTSDAFDLNTADGVCDTDILTPGPQCSLRAAVMTANASAEPDTVLLPLSAALVLTLGGAGGAESGDLDVVGTLTVAGYTDKPPADPLTLARIDASALGDRLFDVPADSSLTLRGLRLRNGGGVEDGGAVRATGELALDTVLLTGHVTERGGAIALDGEALLEVVDSHFEGNEASTLGAALFVGGSSSATVRRSSFRDNVADAASGGGTIYVEDSAILVIEDSTLDGATSGLVPPALAAGSGVQAYGGADVTLRGTTVVGFTDYGLYLETVGPGSVVRVANTILAAQVAGCAAVGNFAASDAVIANSHVQTDIGCSTAFVEVASLVPQVAPSEPDAGRFTHSRPLAGAFARGVDEGVSADTMPDDPRLACTATDQRGTPRPQDGNGDDVPACDIGAVELPAPIEFLVDTESDLLDANPGDGVCAGLAVVGSPACSVRAAVMEANALPGVQRIRFVDDLGALLLQQPAAADASGGDLDIVEGLIIWSRLLNGYPDTAIAQNENDDRVLDIELPAGDRVVLRGIELSSGDAVVEPGGAIRFDGGGQLFVIESVVRSNRTDGPGGGIAALDGTLLLLDSELRSNASTDRGTALYVAADAEASVIRSSVNGNLGIDAGSSSVAAIDVDAGGALQLVSSTVAENSEGIVAVTPDQFAVIGSTLSRNPGGGITVTMGANGSLQLAASIIAENREEGSPEPPRDCKLFDLEDAISAAIDYVLSTSGNCVEGSSTSVLADPELAPLAAFGHRPGKVMRPAVPTSPALDVAPAQFCVRYDQGNAFRPQDLPEVPDIDGACDLGAVEAVPDALFADGFED